MLECKRCGNKDIAYFYLGQRGYYCRKCIGFSRLLLEEEIESPEYEISYGSDEYHFDYELTLPQKIASEKCAECIEYNNVLLFSICGSGKTEIVVESISRYLSRGKKVAYAISRREVVIELSKRFEKIFPFAKVVAVYGNHHDILYGDLIVCTCHQLYRYYKTFDLLIMDEVDAFPLKGNETLLNISINSCKGHIIFSTATIDDNLKRILNRTNYSLVELYVRPSFKPLVIPKIIKVNRLSIILVLFYLLSKSKRQSIIFVSSKKDCKMLHLILSKFYSCTYVYADLEDRDKNIEAFRNNKYQHIIATSVLERGLTIKKIDVIIVSLNDVFEESNYVQMLGRIGRGVDNNEGEGYILCRKKDKEIRKTINYLKEANNNGKMYLL